MHIYTHKCWSTPVPNIVEFSSDEVGVNSCVYGPHRMQDLVLAVPLRVDPHLP